MHKLLSVPLLLILSSQALSLPVPALQGIVNDYGNVLNNEDEKSLSAKIEAHEKATTDQIVILTIPTLSGDDIARFGQDVGDTWKIGHKGSDNGVIIIQSVLDRKIRIQTGRGVEWALPDAKCKRIISEMAPYFKKNDFKGGYNKAVDNIISSLKQGGIQAEAPAAQAPAIPASKKAIIVFLVIIVLSIGVSCVIAISAIRKKEEEEDSSHIQTPPYTPQAYTPQAYTPLYSTPTPPPPKSRSSSTPTPPPKSRSSSSSSSSSSSFDFGGSSSYSSGGFDSGGFSGGGGGFDGGGASGDY